MILFSKKVTNLRMIDVQLLLVKASDFQALEETVQENFPRRMPSGQYPLGEFPPGEFRPYQISTRRKATW